MRIRIEDVLRVLEDTKPTLDEIVPELEDRGSLERLTDGDHPRPEDEQPV